MCVHACSSFLACRQAHHFRCSGSTVYVLREAVATAGSLRCVTEWVVQQTRCYVFIASCGGFVDLWAKAAPLTRSNDQTGSSSWRTTACWSGGLMNSRHGTTHLTGQSSTRACHSLIRLAPTSASMYGISNSRVFNLCRQKGRPLRGSTCFTVYWAPLRCM